MIYHMNKNSTVETGRVGGLKRVANMTAKELSEANRHAANVRWKKERENRKIINGKK